MTARTVTAKLRLNRLVVKRGAVPPSVYLMHISDKQWEKFIEAACRQRVNPKYVQVKLLGNARDKGRDVEARLQTKLDTDQWDLYQAKHYASRLTPSDAFPEMAKFFGHLLAKSYPVPRKYFFCAPQNAGPDLHDLMADGAKLKAQFLNAWKNEKQGMGAGVPTLTDEMESLVHTFDFDRFEECLVHELLDWHARDVTAHYKLFGIEPERGDDPAVPEKEQPHEMNYVEELMRVYSEHAGSPISLDEVRVVAEYAEHFASQREVFYSAEGLRLFSRDIYPEDEFARLLEMVRKGVRPSVSNPRLTAGLDRLQAALDAVSGLALTDSVLHPRLRGGDLPGTCHHLANEKQIKWTR
jgi:hypothetical protein